MCRVAQANRRKLQHKEMQKQREEELREAKLRAEREQKEKERQELRQQSALNAELKQGSERRFLDESFMIHDVES